MNPDVTSVLAKLREQLPAMLQHELLTGPMGLNFETALSVGMVLRDVVLGKFIESVTVQTAGTVTVVDHRTKARCPDCDDSGLTDHDPAMTPCASCRPA